MGITALIARIASVTVSAVALSKEVHMASFVDQLSKNVSVALTTQEIIDKKIEDKVNALEESIPLMGQEITNLKINCLGEEPRWRRSRTGRTLSPPQIHQKSI